MPRNKSRRKAPPVNQPKPEESSKAGVSIFSWSTALAVFLSALPALGKVAEKLVEMFFRR